MNNGLRGFSHQGIVTKNSLPKHGYKKPLLSEFAIDHFPTGSVITQAEDGIYMEDGSSTYPDISRPLPAALYTISFGFIPQITASDYNGVMVVLTDTTTGRILGIRLAAEGNFLRMYITLWNSYGNFYDNPYVNMFTPSQFQFLRIKNDGTNISYQHSSNGTNYTTYKTLSNTYWLTPNRIGFAVDNGGSAINAGALLFHYSESPFDSPSVIGV